MHPILFEWGRFQLPTYGVLYLAAFLAGISVAARLARRDLGIPFARYFDVMFMIAIGGEVCSRAVFLLLNWDAFSSGAIGAGQFLVAGRIVLAGVAGGILTATLLFRRHRFPVLGSIDVGMVGVALAMGIGRLGCLAAGCCYGKPTAAAWGLTFSEPLAAQLHGTPLGTPLIPVQLLQALDGFLLFGILLWIQKIKRHDGIVLAAFLVLSGSTRFLAEFLRGDVRGDAFGMHTSQWIGLAMIVAGLALGLRVNKRNVSRMKVAALPDQSRDRAGRRAVLAAGSRRRRQRNSA